MIVRILGEGQLDVADDRGRRLNALDDELEAAVEAGDEDGLPRRAGRPARRGALRRQRRCPTTTLEPSDAVLPAADATLEEVRDLLSDEGLIPG